MKTSASPRVLLAIPAFNCAPQIGRVVDALARAVIPAVERVAVIDNRSTDGTAEVAAAAIGPLDSRFQLWQNSENYGLGGTHKVAFQQALEQGFDAVAVLHGDDQADPGDLPRLVQRWTADPSAAAVLGTRFARGSRRSGYSRTRTLGNIGINALYSLVALRRSSDLGSGLNVFSTSHLRDRAFLDFDDRITFNIDLLLHYFSRHERLLYEPISWREFDQVSNARNLEVGITAVRKVFRWRLGAPAVPDRRQRYGFEVIA